MSDKNNPETRIKNAGSSPAGPVLPHVEVPV